MLGEIIPHDRLPLSLGEFSRGEPVVASGDLDHAIQDALDRIARFLHFLRGRDVPAPRFVEKLIESHTTLLGHAQKRPFDDIRDALRRHVRYGGLKRIHRPDRLLNVAVAHVEGDRTLH